MVSFRLCLIIFFSFGLALHSSARVVTFRNNCTFTIDVDNSKETVCAGVPSMGSCNWTIPPEGWSGQFHRRNPRGPDDKLTGYPSATLAEFTFGDQTKNETFNWDWFDISIIPPGCSGTIMSYQGCIDASDSYLNDGYDVGMEMKPLGCLDMTRLCLDKHCDDAYGYPKDDTKTTVCKDLFADWEVTFCPTGSCVDVPGEPTTYCSYDAKSLYRNSSNTGPPSYPSNTSPPPHASNTGPSPHPSNTGPPPHPSTLTCCVDNS